MADDLIARGLADTPRLDTVSYYDDSEPNWDERPYFTRVEQKRCRTGTHINVASDQSLSLDVETVRFPALPGSGGRPTQVAKQFVDCLQSGQNRVVLSGIGGDEVTGGVPTPIVELQDLLARAQLGQFARQLKTWALEKRTPWLQLLLKSAGELLPLAQARRLGHRELPAWLQGSFISLYRSALQGYESPLKLLGPLPSSQQSVATLHALQRQLGCSPLPRTPVYEKRYPYLDRDLLEFLFAIPREQLLRPGQRRSLMRRALVGIVPPEVLNRRRKAYAGRTTMRALLNDPRKLQEFTENMLAESFGIVDSKTFLEALQAARNGNAIPTVTVMRTLSVELWLRRLRDQGVLENGNVGCLREPTHSRTHFGTTVLPQISASCCNKPYKERR
jgi:asparagine synthase (glutamine-hydrolysing)